MKVMRNEEGISCVRERIAGDCGVRVRGDDGRVYTHSDYRAY